MDRLLLQRPHEYPPFKKRCKHVCCIDKTSLATTYMGQMMGFTTNLLTGIAGALDHFAERAERSGRDTAANGGERNPRPSGPQQHAQNFPPHHYFSSRNEARRFAQRHQIPQTTPDRARPYHAPVGAPLHNGTSSGPGAQSQLPWNYIPMRNEPPGIYTPPPNPAAPYNGPMPSQQARVTGSSATLNSRPLPQNYDAMRGEPAGVYIPPPNVATQYNSPTPSQQAGVTGSSATLNSRPLPQNYDAMRGEPAGVYIPPANLHAR